MKEKYNCVCIPPVPDRITVKSREDLYEKLEQAQRDISEGRVKPAYEMFEKIKERLGLS